MLTKTHPLPAAAVGEEADLYLLLALVATLPVVPNEGAAVKQIRKQAGVSLKKARVSPIEDPVDCGSKVS